MGKDGKAIQAKNDNVVVYDLTNGKEKLRMAIPRSGAGPVAFAADSQTLPGIAVNEKLQRIDVHDNTGKKLQNIGGFTGKVRPPGVFQ